MRRRSVCCSRLASQEPSASAACLPESPLVQGSPLPAKPKKMPAHGVAHRRPSTCTCHQESHLPLQRPDVALVSASGGGRSSPSTLRAGGPGLRRCPAGSTATGRGAARLHERVSGTSLPRRVDVASLRLATSHGVLREGPSAPVCLVFLQIGSCKVHRSSRVSKPFLWVTASSAFRLLSFPSLPS